MGKWTQADRRMAIETPLGEDVLLLRSFELYEEIGRPFVCEVELTSEDPEIDLNAIIGENVTIRLERGDGETRYFNGFVSRIQQGGGSGSASMHLYAATIVPWLWFLTRSSDCRIFQHKTIPEILKEVFDEFVFAESVENKLTDTYQPREFVVQYRETAFNFVSRLMEQEGIYYYFVHEKGVHKLVLADAPSAHEHIPGYEELSCQGDAQTGKHSVGEWTIERRVVPGKHALTDFDFKVPTKAMICERAGERSHAASHYEAFDYPGLYTDRPDGDVFATVRLQEVELCHEVVTAKTDARGLGMGCKFNLTGSARGDQDREYVIVSMRTTVREESYDTAPGGNTEEFFSAAFKAIEAGVQIRTERSTLKPLINGPQTAIVTGSAGDEITTDEYGRVKVRFHWDRWSEADEKSSCWIRVSQGWAGKKWGAIYIPRIGQEVIVEFLDGDPDRPIITGRVYNGDMMPPYQLPANKTVSTLKSHSSKGASPDNFNEIKFEDRKGEELLYIQAEKDRTVLVKNNNTESVGHDEAITVGNDRTKDVGNNETTTIGADRTETVGSNETITIGIDRAESVGSNENISIGASRTELVGNSETVTIAVQRTHTIGVNDTLTVGVAQEVTVGAAQAITVGANQDLNVGINRSTSIGKEDELTVGKKLTITAGDEITFKTGEASITMKKDGTIIIKGKDITIQGSGKITGKADKDMVLKAQKILQN